MGLLTDSEKRILLGEKEVSSGYKAVVRCKVNKKRLDKKIKDVLQVIDDLIFLKGLTDPKKTKKDLLSDLPDEPIAPMKFDIDNQLLFDLMDRQLELFDLFLKQRVITKQERKATRLPPSKGRKKLPDTKHGWSKMWDLRHENGAPLKKPIGMTNDLAYRTLLALHRSIDESLLTFDEAKRVYLDSYDPKKIFVIEEKNNGEVSLEWRNSLTYMFKDFAKELFDRSVLKEYVTLPMPEFLDKCLEKEQTKRTEEPTRIILARY